jgi:hypothetical protein
MPPEETPQLNLVTPAQTGTAPAAATIPTAETPQAETKTTPSTTTETKSLINEPVAPPGAPDTYSNWNVPEGWQIQDEANTQINTMFKDIGLSQEAGQRLVDFYVQKTEEAAQAPYKMYEQMRKDWRDEVAKDPDIGGRLDQVRQTIGRAINSLGDARLAQSFREAMDLTGAGDNPAFIRAFYRFAQRLTEQTHVVGNGPALTGQTKPGSGPRTMAQAMYPDLRSSNE